jgi:DNA adenine methylase
MSQSIRTPLRYPGGKFRALKRILAQLPEHMEEFREPFVGGGSVFLAMKRQFGERIRHYWINDLNYDLVCFWRYARDDNPALVKAVRAFKTDYAGRGRELHAYLKDENNIGTDFERAVRFFVMNRITFSGTIDSGGYSQSAFDKRFTDSSIERLARIEPYMQDVKITHGDYEPVLHEPGEDVFIFLDPPYYSATKSKLYGHKGDLHTGFDHERYAQNMQACPHRWLITYDDSPEIRHLFNFGCHLVEWQLQYGMNNYKQGSAARGQELFIRNYDR